MTPRMKQALRSVYGFVARHGALPSRRILAGELACAPSNADRLLECLIERGELSRLDKGALALGGAGVAIVVPAVTAAALARYCQDKNESISAVASDAILLHLDQCENAEPFEVAE